MSAKTCGQCEHAVFDKGLPLTERICYGGPEQVVVVVINGKAVMNKMRPNVSVGQRACGAFLDNGSVHLISSQVPAAPADFSTTQQEGNMPEARTAEPLAPTLKTT